MSKKKKTIIIAVVIILSFTIMGIVYALLTDHMGLVNRIKIGTVQIDNLNLRFVNSEDEHASAILPADINTVKWTTKNIGTSGVLTRHTLEIYWNEDVENISEEARKMLYLYPANMTDTAILTDFEKGSESQYMLKAEVVTEEVGGKVKKGIKYQFVGDTLNGTDMKNVSKEVNYNSSEELIIDKNIVTDDSSNTIDEIAFKVLMNPKTSYLYEEVGVSINVTTEAMQYTEDGSANWQVVDTQEI